MPKQSCQKLVDTLGISVFQNIAAYKIKGEVSADLEAAYHFKKEQSDFRINELTNTCQILDDRGLYSKLALRNRLRHVFEPLNSPQALSFIKSSYQSQLAPHLSLLLVAAEDSGFWSHPGWQKSTIEVAIKEKLSASKNKIGSFHDQYAGRKKSLFKSQQKSSEKTRRIYFGQSLKKALVKKRSYLSMQILSNMALVSMESSKLVSIILKSMHSVLHLWRVCF